MSLDSRLTARRQALSYQTCQIPEKKMITDQNRASVRQLVEGLGTNGSSSAFDVLHEDAVWTVMADADTFPVSGDMAKPAFIEHMRRFHDSLPHGIHVAVTSVIADDANASVEATSNALLANGKTLNQVYHFAFEFKDGKVVRAREYIDTARALFAFSP
ncbi:nuclear transport factor 2 family protein [Pseudonocardia sp. KRD291]|uniref:nuclear transport factor 2 family protein n=1 Tax=Pseudonocardia sp. KRD291 TaxID=2792007 RepID=UPI001C4A2E3F|nr:nuclear transport factor 2 family protein [Pseudonocardia sp. KRD291]MBW0101064.1 nuclear transport factor 2 family protein [Pseudonocardia sp. KRD291]